jgi:hypothetical protein
MSNREALSDGIKSLTMGLTKSGILNDESPRFLFDLSMISDGDRKA